MTNRWIAALLLVPGALFLVGCNQLPSPVANADESIEIVSANGTVAPGRMVTVRNIDGTTRKMVVMDRAVPEARSSAAPARYQTASYRRPRASDNPGRTYPRKRTWQKSAMIIGGSAGAGALIGGVAKGKKGAGVGALAGGLGGLAYDLLTRNKS
jgi:hypothetical protein